MASLAHLKGGLKREVPHAARVLALCEAQGEGGGAPGLGASDVPHQVAGKAVLGQGPALVELRKAQGNATTDGGLAIGHGDRDAPINSFPVPRAGLDEAVRWEGF